MFFPLSPDYKRYVIITKRSNPFSMNLVFSQLNGEIVSISHIHTVVTVPQKILNF